MANERSSNFESREEGATLSFNTAGVNGGGIMGGKSRRREKSVSYVPSSLSSSSPLSIQQINLLSPLPLLLLGI